MTTIRSSRIEVTAVPAGAELTSIKGKDGTEYLWQADPAYWPRRSPLLFPIVGALPGGAYSHEGRTYRLGNHGFARERDFSLTKQAGDFVRFELAADEASLTLYPFRFRLAVEYRAEDDAVAVAYEVTNEGAQTMHFSIGSHPGFRAPIIPGETRADFELVFEKAETVVRHFLNADNVATGASAPFLSGTDRAAVTNDLFEPGAIVLKDHRSRALTLKSRKSGRFVRVEFPGFDYLGIWSPKGDCPFVCIEPWHGVMPLAASGGELARKEGVRHLEPGARFASTYRIVVG